MTGMTMKQWRRARFLTICEALAGPIDSAAFVALSVEVHGLKAHVPRAWWKRANVHGTRIVEAPRE